MLAPAVAGRPELAWAQLCNVLQPTRPVSTNPTASTRAAKRAGRERMRK